jgi:hypothetical protein
MAPSEDRSTIAGLSNMPAQATSMAGPTITGYLFEHATLALTFVLGGVLQLVNTALFWAFFHHMPPPEEVGRDATPRRQDTRTPVATVTRVEEHATGDR